MIRKVVIKLFRLSDIAKMLKNAKENQKKLDEKYWREQVHDTVESLNREHALEIQEKESQILMLEDKIKTYKSREKELDTKEHFIKREAKENAFMATKIALKVEEFGLKIVDIMGEMKGVKDDAEENKRRIEQK